jgi:hypothetical protein
MSDIITITEYQRVSCEVVAGLTDLISYSVAQMDHAKELIDNGLHEEARDLLATTSDALLRCRAVSDAHRPRS